MLKLLLALQLFQPALSAQFDCPLQSLVPHTTFITSGTVSPYTGTAACGSVAVPKPYIWIDPPQQGHSFLVYTFDDGFAHNCVNGAPAHAAALSCITTYAYWSVVSFSPSTVDWSSSITLNPDLTLLSDNIVLTQMGPYPNTANTFNWQYDGYSSSPPTIPTGSSWLGVHIYAQVLEAYSTGGSGRWLASDIADATIF